MNGAFTKVSILFLLIMGALEARAGTAKVRKVVKKKKLILINSGKADGLKRGQKVCFYRKESSDRKVACGKVKRLKSTQALVKVKRPKKIKVGFVAKYNLGRTRPRPAPRLPPGYIVVSPTAAQQVPGAAPKRKSYDLAVRGLWLPYLLPYTQANYNLLTYDGAHSLTGQSLWASEGSYSEGENSRIFLSFGGEIEFKSIGLRLGGRYKVYQPFASDTDYDASKPNIYLSSSLFADSIGGYVDAAFYFTEFSLGFGLEIDSTSLGLVSTLLDDNDAGTARDIYGIGGTTYVLSLRIPLRWDPFFDPVGLSFGINLMIPLTTFGTSVVVEEGDSLNASKVTSVEDDAIEALNFGKGSVALEFVAGAFFGF